MGVVAIFCYLVCFYAMILLCVVIIIIVIVSLISLPFKGHAGPRITGQSRPPFLYGHAGPPDNRIA